MALAGVSDVYSASNDLLAAFLGLHIAGSQVYRVTNTLGEALTQPLAQPLSHPPLATDEVVYASMDGSMILTDSGWQEIKLGRVFASQSRVTNGQKDDGQTRFRLRESTYSGHLGPFGEFTVKFEASLGTYKIQPERLVFVTDGAVWIQHYIEQTYPLATHILDYYHALEHLAAFARLHFAHPWVRTQWVETQQAHLLSDELDAVLGNLAALKKLSPEARKERINLVAYYGQNRQRMQYGSFRARGLLIGSGPMEAAHRTVIQTRMKRSGQRWTDRGAQAMINMRVAFKSDRWHLVKQQLKEDTR
jgi:hypothetical protein